SVFPCPLTTLARLDTPSLHDALPISPEIASQACTIGEISDVISISSWCAPMALHTSGCSLYFSANCIPRIACGNSGLSSGTLPRSEEHTSELQSRENLVCRLLLEKKK